MAQKSASETLKGFSGDDLALLAFDSPDWPTALMIGSFLELLLEQMMVVRLHTGLTKRERLELFTGFGPLASFSSKIAVGYALSVFTDDARNDLRIIKFIRNAAAHRIKEFSFENNDIKQLCGSLKLIAPMTEGELKPSQYHEKWRALGSKTPRAKFIISAFHIMTDMSALCAVNAKIRVFMAAVANLGVNRISDENFIEVLKKLKIDLLTVTGGEDRKESLADRVLGKIGLAIRRKKLV